MAYSRSSSTVNQKVGTFAINYVQPPLTPNALGHIKSSIASRLELARFYIQGDLFSGQRQNPIELKSTADETCHGICDGGNSCRWRRFLRDCYKTNRLINISVVETAFMPSSGLTNPDTHDQIRDIRAYTWRVSLVETPWIVSLPTKHTDVCVWHLQPTFQIGPIKHQRRCAKHTAFANARVTRANQ